MRFISLLVSTLFLLVACGTRGPLVLPPKPTADDHSSKPAEQAR
ncbi:MAG: lipoprotein [Rhodocyclales bacterium]|jgi:predicted small lipoprotein YifL|nr:lipoprotein [Rhodocyclales bacterium]MBI5786271.1 lipoprotein [Rhodocyclales bacterium]